MRAAKGMEVAVAMLRKRGDTTHFMGLALLNFVLKHT
jgi:hypothetical protein